MLLEAPDSDQGSVGASDHALSTARRAYRPLLADTAPDHSAILESMILPRNRPFIRDTLKRVGRGEPPAAASSGLVLVGPTGAGKTYALSCLHNALGGNARYVNLADLDTEVERAARLRVRAELNSWLVGTQMLLLDDLHLASPAVQSELETVTDGLFRSNRLFCATTNVTLDKLRLTSTLKARLKGAVQFQLQPADSDMRGEYLRRMLGLRLEQKAYDLLAERCPGDFHQLRGVAATLQAHASGAGAKLKAADVIAALGEAGFDFGAGSVGRKKRVTVPVEPKKLDRFREMLSSAESPAEQVLALEIALSERLRQLRQAKGAEEEVARIEKGLGLLRQGDLAEAIACMKI
jgi:hypothetical protein